MRIGMVGLGRMGTALTARLVNSGHHCVVYDRDPEATARVAAGPGCVAATDLALLAGELPAPRVVWVMVPAAATGEVIAAVAAHLAAGDIVIDGGNSHWRDSRRRAGELSERGILHLDVGTSGGVWGAQRGFCLMVGGAEVAVKAVEPILASLAPGQEAAPRTGGRSGPLGAGEAGWLHCGPPGAGHFVKMAHNAVEYGMMASIAEGLDLLSHGAAGMSPPASDAETSPLREPEEYLYEIDVAAVAEVWRRGSVITSFLVDLVAAALAEDPDLDAFEGRVADSGEGRWSVQAAIDVGVPVPVLSAALFERFASRAEGAFAARVLSAMRHRFGGHEELPSGGGGEGPG